jgi:hypothetical protein
MTNLDTVHNTSSDQAPVADVGDRLVQMHETVSNLQTDAASLRFGIFALLSELEEIIGDPAIRDSAAFDAAIDAATWVSHALENVDDEFETLVAHLSDASEV